MTSQTPPVARAVVTVPREPTEAMLVNGREALLPLIRLDSYGPLIGLWQDMLSAAPHPDPVPPVVGWQARHIEDYHEDDGFALWWTNPVTEPPYCGTPNDSNWPGYHEWWTPLPEPPLFPVADRVAPPAASVSPGIGPLADEPNPTNTTAGDRT